MDQLENVTRQRTLGDRLKRQRDVFLSILRKAPYGAVIIGKNGKYTFINKEFTKITGYTLKDVPDGATWFRKAYPSKAYRMKVIEAWKNDLALKGIKQTFTIKCKDRKQKDVEFRPTPLGKDSWIVMLSDITERRRAEKALQRARQELEERVRERTAELNDMNRALQTEIAERKEFETSLRERELQLSAIIEATDLNIYICSQDYTVEFMNEKLIRRTGYDGTGMPCYQVIHDRTSVCPWCVNARVFKGETVRWEIQSPKDNHWYYVVNTPICNADGTVSKYAMLLDITARKETEEKIGRLNEELKQRVAELNFANRELEAFSYSISHDLATPLVAIEGFSNMLIKRYSEKLDEKGLRLLGIIARSTQQMKDLIDDLLAFSHLGRQKMRLSETNMSRLVAEVCEQLRSIHPGAGLEIIVKDIPGAKCDRTMIRQVFANLIGNAIKYGRKRHPVVIEIGGARSGRDNVYYVKDNGIGFAMEDAKRIFEVFERLHGSDEFEGTGIGLSIVKRVVERHGGKVWAESGVEEGATFCFSIPAG